MTFIAVKMLKSTLWIDPALFVADRMGGADMTKFCSRYGVTKCGTCASLYVNPCPTQEVLNDYYTNYKCNAMLEDVYKKRAHKETSVILDNRVDTIVHCIEKIHKDSIRVLEIGCSNGSFLSRIRARLSAVHCTKKVELVGVDANSNAVAACEDASLNLCASTIEDYLMGEHGTFDIVWHAELIEHIIDPYGLFVKLRAAMSPGGYMIFTTPNDSSLEMRVLSYNVPRVLACNIFPPMHLNAFSTTNVSHFAIRCGFMVEEITTPGNFDVEILEIQREYITDEMIGYVATFTERQKEVLQHILRLAGASSHMQCILRCPDAEAS